MEYIKLFEDPIHINPYLTHWTGRDKYDEEALDILTLIIKDKRLKFSVCPTGYNDDKNYSFFSTMICFTDIPIEQSIEHCKIYNGFGISFIKKNMINKGANPVLYLAENRKKHQEFLADLRFSGNVNFSNNKDYNNYSWVQAILQAYNTEKHSLPEFQEREWRIIRTLPTNLSLKAIKHKGLFDDFDNKDILCYRKKEEEICYLTFDLEDIENIILPKKFEKEAIQLMKDYNLKCKLYIIENMPIINKKLLETKHI